MMPSPFPFLRRYPSCLAVLPDILISWQESPRPTISAHLNFPTQRENGNDFLRNIIGPEQQVPEKARNYNLKYMKYFMTLGDGDGHEFLRNLSSTCQPHQVSKFTRKKILKEKQREIIVHQERI